MKEKESSDRTHTIKLNALSSTNYILNIICKGTYLASLPSIEIYLVYLVDINKQHFSIGGIKKEKENHT
jgi:hypothetical protein